MSLLGVLGLKHDADFQRLLMEEEKCDLMVVNAKDAIEKNEKEMVVQKSMVERILRLLKVVDQIKEQKKKDEKVAAEKSKQMDLTILQLYKEAEFKVLSKDFVKAKNRRANAIAQVASKMRALEEARRLLILTNRFNEKFELQEELEGDICNLEDLMSGDEKFAEEYAEQLQKKRKYLKDVKKWVDKQSNHVRGTSQDCEVLIQKCKEEIKSSQKLLEDLRSQYDKKNENIQKIAREARIKLCTDEERANVLRQKQNHENKIGEIKEKIENTKELRSSILQKIGDCQKAITNAVDRKFRRLVVKKHPDKIRHPTEQDFQVFREIEQARRILRDTHLRTKFFKSGGDFSFEQEEKNSNISDEQNLKRELRRKLRRARNNDNDYSSDDDDAPRDKQVLHLMGMPPNRCKAPWENRAPIRVNNALIAKHGEPKALYKLSMEWDCASAQLSAVSHYSLEMKDISGHAVSNGVEFDKADRFKTVYEGSKPRFISPSVPAGEYMFRVRAYNTFGPGEPNSSDIFAVGRYKTIFNLTVNDRDKIHIIPSPRVIFQRQMRARLRVVHLMRDDVSQVRKKNLSHTSQMDLWYNLHRAIQTCKDLKMDEDHFDRDMILTGERRLEEIESRVSWLSEKRKWQQNLKQMVENGLQTSKGKNIKRGGNKPKNEDLEVEGEGELPVGGEPEQFELDGKPVQTPENAPNGDQKEETFDNMEVYLKTFDVHKLPGPMKLMLFKSLKDMANRMHRTEEVRLFVVDCLLVALQVEDFWSHEKRKSLQKFLGQVRHRNQLIKEAQRTDTLGRKLNKPKKPRKPNKPKKPQKQANIEQEGIPDQKVPKEEAKQSFFEKAQPTKIQKKKKKRKKKAAKKKSQQNNSQKEIEGEPEPQVEVEQEVQLSQEVQSHVPISANSNSYNTPQSEPGASEIDDPQRVCPKKISDSSDNHRHDYNRVRTHDSPNVRTQHKAESNHSHSHKDSKPPRDGQIPRPHQYAQQGEPDDYVIVASPKNAQQGEPDKYHRKPSQPRPQKARSHLHNKHHQQAHPQARPHPQQAQPHPQQAQPHPQQARTHPRQARTHPQQARTHPQQARTHPQQARTHPQPTRTHHQPTRTHHQQARPQHQQARPQHQQARPQHQQARPQHQQARPHPQQDRPHPQQDRPHPQQDRPHYQQDRPHPQQDRPHPQQDRQHPQQARQHPQQARPHPQQDRPHPQQPQSHPQQAQPHPQQAQPYPQQAQHTRSQPQPQHHTQPQRPQPQRQRPQLQPQLQPQPQQYQSQPYKGYPPQHQPNQPQPYESYKPYDSPVSAVPPPTVYDTGPPQLSQAPLQPFPPQQEPDPLQPSHDFLQVQAQAPVEDDYSYEGLRHEQEEILRIRREREGIARMRQQLEAKRRRKTQDIYRKYMEAQRQAEQLERQLEQELLDQELSLDSLQASDQMYTLPPPSMNQRAYDVIPPDVYLSSTAAISHQQEGESIPVAAHVEGVQDHILAGSISSLPPPQDDQHMYFDDPFSDDYDSGFAHSNPPDVTNHKNPPPQGGGECGPQQGRGRDNLQRTNRRRAPKNSVKSKGYSRPERKWRKKDDVDHSNSGEHPLEPGSGQYRPRQSKKNHRNPRSNQNPGGPNLGGGY